MLVLLRIVLTGRRAVLVLAAARALSLGEARRGAAGGVAGRAARLRSVELRARRPRHPGLGDVARRGPGPGAAERRPVPAADRRSAQAGGLERDDVSSSRHPALPLCLSMIFSENR